MPNPKPSESKTRWDRLRETVNNVKESNKVTVQAIANEMDRPYMQVYRWLGGKHVPHGPFILDLLAWVHRQKLTVKQRAALQAVYSN